MMIGTLVFSKELTRGQVRANGIQDTIGQVKTRSHPHCFLQSVFLIFSRDAEHPFYYMMGDKERRREKQKASPILSFPFVTFSKTL